MPAASRLSCPSSSGPRAAWPAPRHSPYCRNRRPSLWGQWQRLSSTRDQGVEGPPQLASSQPRSDCLSWGCLSPGLAALCHMPSALGTGKQKGEERVSRSVGTGCLHRSPPLQTRTLRRKQGIQRRPTTGWPVTERGLGPPSPWRAGHAGSFQLLPDFGVVMVTSSCPSPFCYNHFPKHPAPLPALPSRCAGHSGYILAGPGQPVRIAWREDDPLQPLRTEQLRSPH